MLDGRRCAGTHFRRGYVISTRCLQRQTQDWNYRPKLKMDTKSSEKEQETLEQRLERALNKSEWENIFYHSSFEGFKLDNNVSQNYWCSFGWSCRYFKCPSGGVAFYQLKGTRIQICGHDHGQLWKHEDKLKELVKESFENVLQNK